MDIKYEYFDGGVRYIAPGRSIQSSQYKPDPGFPHVPVKACSADTNGEGVASSQTTHKGWAGPVSLSADDLLTLNDQSESPVRSLNDYILFGNPSTFVGRICLVAIIKDPKALSKL